VAKRALDLGAYQVLHKPFEMHHRKSILEKSVAPAINSIRIFT